MRLIQTLVRLTTLKPTPYPALGGDRLVGHHIRRVPSYQVLRMLLCHSIYVDITR